MSLEEVNKNNFTPEFKQEFIDIIKELLEQRPNCAFWYEGSDGKDLYGEDIIPAIENETPEGLSQLRKYERWKEKAEAARAAKRNTLCAKARRFVSRLVA